MKCSLYHIQYIIIELMLKDGTYVSYSEMKSPSLDSYNTG